MIELIVMGRTYRKRQCKEKNKVWWTNCILSKRRMASIIYANQSGMQSTSLNMKENSMHENNTHPVCYSF